jgi:hypothetical protein
LISYNPSARLIFCSVITTNWCVVGLSVANLFYILSAMPWTFVLFIPSSLHLNQLHISLL